jgi:hypothetical protein
MTAVVFLVCVAVGLLLHFAVVRPFLMPVEWKIPSSRAYVPTFGARSAR